MTKHITHPRDRKTPKYKAIHANLRTEMVGFMGAAFGMPPELVSEPSKSQRKRAKSSDYRTHGGGE